MSYALLSPLFFSEQRPTKEFVQNTPFPAKFTGQWSEFFFPIYQWQENVFVGVAPTFTPPFENEIGYIFVQVEASLLGEIWTEIMTPATVEKKITPTEPKLSADGTVADPFSHLVAEPAELTEPEKTGLTEIDREENSNSGLLDIDLSNMSAVKLIPLSQMKELEDAQNPSELASQVKTALNDPESSTLTDIRYAENPTLKISGKIIGTIFKDLHYHFQKSMILIRQEDQLIPWKWDEEFEKTASKKGSNVDLKKASPFRIVTRTHKPYHGHLVHSDVLETFLEDWNQSSTPDHLTIVPLEFEGELFGVILAIGQISAYNNSSLQLAEKLAVDFTQAIQNNAIEAA